jgi:hypothetical protein
VGFSFFSSFLVSKHAEVVSSTVRRGSVFELPFLCLSIYGRWQIYKEKVSLCRSVIPETREQMIAG